MIEVDYHLKNAYFLDVFTKTFVKTELWIKETKIIFRGRSKQYSAKETLDLGGRYVAPGLIDAHMHIESSLLTPSELGKILVKHGVTRAFADPHEIASVSGESGIHYMIGEARQAPIHFHYMLPSSVPAAPFERTGAVLDAESLRTFYQYPEVHGLAEVMDYPAVANGNPDMLEKIADAQKAGRHVDGHGAGLNPEQLAVYRAVGIDTDHEAHSTEMALERLNAGMRVFIREGTVERDELAILPAVTSANAERFAFCTDDKNVTDLLLEGSIDYNVNLAVSKGLAMETALKMASYGAAQAHHLQNVGALAAGYVADLVVFDSLQHFSAQEVMVAGQWVTEKQTTKPLAFAPQAINIKLQLNDFELPLINGVAHVIGIEPNHITTTHLIEEVPRDSAGKFSANQTYAKIAVFERYHQLGHGLGIIKGFKLRGGAIAATVAHDSHNLIVAGRNDSAMYTAANHLRELGGGMVVVEDDGTITSLPLPIAGLMSEQPYSVVAEQVTTLMAAFERISAVEFDPFLTLSFMALPVIPSLKITDQGLFDFEKFTFININAQ